MRSCLQINQFQCNFLCDIQKHSWSCNFLINLVSNFRFNLKVKAQSICTKWQKIILRIKLYGFTNSAMLSLKQFFSYNFIDSYLQHCLIQAVCSQGTCGISACSYQFTKKNLMFACKLVTGKLREGRLVWNLNHFILSNIVFFIWHFLP